MEVLHIILKVGLKRCHFSFNAPFSLQKGWSYKRGITHKGFHFMLIFAYMSVILKGAGVIHYIPLPLNTKTAACYMNYTNN
jgi:hypothetical protein